MYIYNIYMKSVAILASDQLPDIMFPSSYHHVAHCWL